MQYILSISMDITANYAQHLRSENLQENSIRSYLSDVHQFLQWKEMFAPKAEISNNLIDQYIRTYSFTRSSHTTRRKLTGLTKFYNWFSSTTPSNTKVSLKGKSYLSYAGAFLVVTLSLAGNLSTPTVTQHYNIDTNYQDLNQKAPSSISTQMPDELPKINKPIDIAVSGYELNTMGRDNSSEVILALHEENQEEVMQEMATAFGGTEQIEKLNTYTIILHNSLRKNSIITVTPTAATNGQALYIESQGDGYAVVAIEEPINSPIPFNWLSM